MHHLARRTTRIAAAGAAATALILGAAACGDDDDNGDDSNTTTTSAMMQTTTGGYGDNNAEGDKDDDDRDKDMDSTRMATPDGMEVEISDEIYQKYQAAGGAGSPLGMPEGAEIDGPSGGEYQNFEGGTIYYSERTGAHIVWGDIRETWEANGGAEGELGYPTSDEEDTADGGKKSTFSGGTITWMNGETTVTMN